MRFFILRIYFFFLKLEEIVPEKSVLQKISRKGRFRYIDGRDDLDIYNVHSIRHEIHHKKVLWKTFREESYLDKQVDRLTDAEWLAPPGLSASTTQTLYPRHSWSVSLPLPVIRNSLHSSSFTFVWFSFGFRLLLRCLRFPGLLTCLLETPSCPVHGATYDKTSSRSGSLRFF